MGMTVAVDRSAKSSAVAGLLLLLGAPHAVHALPPECTPLPHSNVGCEFYALTLPNSLLDQLTFSFGLDLLNAGAADVQVSVDGGALGAPDLFSVTAGASVTTALPWVAAIAASTDTEKVLGGAYHVTASAPVAALQLNPSEYTSNGAYSGYNDASLLLPVQSAGLAYRVVAWPTINIGGTQFPGHIAIVGTAAATIVQVDAPGSIAPGAGLTANGGTVSLDAGDVLLISSALDAASAGTSGSDLSGTLISSSAPVLVWTGHDAAQVPAGVSYADHLEEILPPIAALSGDYFVVRPGNPSGSASGARHYVKLVGTVDGTAISTDPVIGGAPTTLQAGSVATFEALDDFHLVASQPVVVATFMEGALATIDFNGNGDPSQSIPIPTGEARTAVDFVASPALSPAFAQLVAPTGASVTVDGALAIGWTAIGSSGYSSTNVSICCTDVHHARGSQPFTLSVYSYPTNTSYWYPGFLGIGDAIFADGFE